MNSAKSAYLLFEASSIKSFVLPNLVVNIEWLTFCKSILSARVMKDDELGMENEKGYPNPPTFISLKVVIRKFISVSISNVGIKGMYLNLFFSLHD